MKVIIAGTRTITDFALVERAIKESGFDISVVVCGTPLIARPDKPGEHYPPRGVDQLGAEWAKRHGVPVVDFPADWKKFGYSAGPRRNGQMAKYGEALIAVMNRGGSKGTLNMIEQAERCGLKIHVHLV